MDEPKELGTLIVVVGKARNLPNKSRFGKQDPFCTITLLESGEKKRTRTVKRGGQHPEWDDEVRFVISEELEDILKMPRSESMATSTMSSSTSLASVASRGSPGVVTPQTLAMKARKNLKKGGKSMRVACYADDPKEPELIGDCYVGIDEVLRKGEIDEWYEFMYKDKYAGEVYLELTFYSNDAPPIKRDVLRPSLENYGPAGVFASTSSMPSSSSLNGHIPTSGSASGMDLYIPPYAHPGAGVRPGTVVPPSSFGDLGLPPSHRMHSGLNPEQPAFPPQMATTPRASLPSMDALTRPVSAVAMNGPHGPPLPPPSLPPSSSIKSLERQSVEGLSGAPWEALLPQNQAITTPPHRRPMSTNDALPWDQVRRTGTPVSRPMSGAGFGNVRPGDTIPSSLRPGTPSTPGSGSRPHAHSFTYADRPVVTSLLHSASPSPAPSHFPASAPPMASSLANLSLSTSSFERVAQALNADHDSPLGGSPYNSRPQSMYDPLKTPIAPYQPTPPRRMSAFQSVTTTPDRANSSLNHGFSLVDTGVQPPPPIPRLSRPHTPTNDRRPDPQTPTSVSVQSTRSTPSYVPWYQQTQSTIQQSTSSPAPTPPRPAFGPPPVPGGRPIPNPPGPPKQGVGYYPSDELYIRSQNEINEVYTSQSPPRSTPTQAMAQAFSQSPRPMPGGLASDDQWNETIAEPNSSSNWQSSLDEFGHRQEHSAPAHGSQQNGEDHYDQSSFYNAGRPSHHHMPTSSYDLPQVNGLPSPHHEIQSAPPAIPSGRPDIESRPTSYYGPNGQNMPASTSPPTAPPSRPTSSYFTPPPRHPLAQSHDKTRPTSLPYPPPRSPSPLPPPPQHPQALHSTTPQLPPQPSFSSQPDTASTTPLIPAPQSMPFQPDWRSTTPMAPPPHVHAGQGDYRTTTPLPPPQANMHAPAATYDSPHMPNRLAPLPAHRSPVVNPPAPSDTSSPSLGSSLARQKWRPSLQNPPASSFPSQAMGVNGAQEANGQGQKQWYTTPPSSSGESLAPAGWKPTLPAQIDGHQWRG